MVRSVLALLVSALLGTAARAAIVEVNLTVALEPLQVRECGGEGGAYPAGTYCWQNDFYGFAPNVAPTVLGADDTLLVHVSFADGARLRWFDDEISAPFYGDESVWVQAYGVDAPGSYAGGTSGNFLAFTKPTGNLLADNLTWNQRTDAAGVFSLSLYSDTTNLTDTAFEFSGLTQQIGPFTGGSGFPLTIDRVDVYFVSGVFEIVPAVPAPPAIWLLGTGCAAMVALGRRGKPAPAGEGQRADAPTCPQIQPDRIG